MRTRAALAAGALALAVVTPPLLLPSARPGDLLVIAVLTVVGAVSAAWDRGRRGRRAAGALGHPSGGPGHGPCAAVAVVSGVLLRLWVGLPELVRLGPAVLPELVGEVVGGAAAAALVVLAGRRVDVLSPMALLAALVSAALLVGAVAVRLRH